MTKYAGQMYLSMIYLVEDTGRDRKAPKGTGRKLSGKEDRYPTSSGKPYSGAEEAIRLTHCGVKGRIFQVV